MRTLLVFFFGPALVAGALGASAEAAPGAASAHIPAATFAALPVLRKPMLSPDGRRIAARATVNGQSTLVVLDANQPEAAVRNVALGDTILAELHWAGSQRLLLTVLTIGRVGPQTLPFFRLIAVDLWTGKSRVVDGNSEGMIAGDVLFTHPDGSWALVASQDDISSYPSVKRVDLATGRASLVEKARTDVWEWYADDKGVVRAGIGREGKRWTLWYRDQPDEKMRKIRAKIDTDDDSAIDKFIFRGGNSWVVTNERTGRFGLYRYDVATGAVGAAIFEHPTVDLDDVLYDPATGEVNAITYQDDRERTTWLDPEMKALQAKLDRALPGNVNMTVDWSIDKQRALVWSKSASNPGRYFLLDRRAFTMHAVVDPYPEIDSALLSEVRPIRYRARDGLEIPGYLTLPRGRATQRLPLIVLPHGGPFARDEWVYSPLVQFLANRGYAVLQPEFRGSTGYGKAFVSRGFGEWGKRMQDDVDDGVSWLASTGQIDANRVCIVGTSYGGYAAMWGAIRNPDRYRCAASWAGVSDVGAMLRDDRRSSSAAPRYFREWRTKVAGDGRFDPAAISPINFAERLKIPIFIAHGEKDNNVSPEQSRKMVDALLKAGGKVTSVFYKSSGHDFDTSQDFQNWLERLDVFLAKHNPK